MAATIVRQRKLRTGDLEFSATTASDVDQYLVVLSERCDKGTVSSLFIARTDPITGPNPIPKGTLKQLGSDYLICDRIQVASEKSQSRIFRVNVHWKELSAGEPPLPQSSPVPSNESLDPDDWSPTWSRRSQIVFVEQREAKMFYRGGYSGDAHTYFSVPANVRKVVGNSTTKEPLRNPPARRRKLDVWNFRWLRPTVPGTLVEAEQKINSATFTIVIGSYAFEWAARTALIDSVELTKTKWGSLTLCEISVDVVVNPDGWDIQTLDSGLYKKDQYIGAGVWAYGLIKDANNLPVREPRNLDGDGHAIESGEVFATWSDYESVAFATVELLNTLGT